METKEIVAIAKRLRKIRGKRSQRGFALELGVNQQNVNRYECAENVPHASFLIQLVRQERVNLNWLLTGVGHERIRR